MPKVAFLDSSRQAGLGGFGFFGFGGLFGVLSPMWHLLAGSIERPRDRVPLATRGAPFGSAPQARRFVPAFASISASLSRTILATSPSGSGASGVKRMAPFDVPNGASSVL